MDSGWGVCGGSTMPNRKRPAWRQLGEMGYGTAAPLDSQEGDCLRWVMSQKDKADKNSDVKQENDCRVP